MGLKYVWRVDTRPPSVIFEQGFQNLGPERDFFGHIVSTNFGQSFFVAASENPTAAMRFFGSWFRENVPDHPREAYLYQIRANNLIYDARLTGENLYDYVMSGDVSYDEGDRDIARMGLRALRTSFAYQREFFSDGPIPREQIRSAFRLDEVPIQSSHVHHPSGRVIGTTRINEPEIFNPHYQDLDSSSNDEPWMPPTALTLTPLHLRVPEGAVAADVAEGVHSSLGFFCHEFEPGPSGPRKRRETQGINGDNHSHLTGFAKNNYKNYYDNNSAKGKGLTCSGEFVQSISKIQFFSEFADSASDKRSTEVYLIDNDNNLFKLTLPNSQVLPGASFFLTKNLKQKLVKFYYDSYQRICSNQGYELKSLEFALTSVKTNVAGVFQLKIQLAVTNDKNQRWKLKPIDKTFKKYRLSSETFDISDNGIFYDPNRVLDSNNLFLTTIKNGSHNLKELYLFIGDLNEKDKTYPGFVTSCYALTHFVDLGLKWACGSNFYQPLINGWSQYGNPPPYSLLYDYRTEMIFFFSKKLEIFALYNKRDANKNSWDWIMWIKISNLLVADQRYKWYFSRRKIQTKDVLGNHLRAIRSSENNDWLKIIPTGSNWGGWYTSQWEKENNSSKSFVINGDFDNNSVQRSKIH